MAQTTQIAGNFDAAYLATASAAQSEVNATNDITAHIKQERIAGIDPVEITLRKITSAAGKDLWIPSQKALPADLGNGLLEWTVDVLQSAKNDGDITEKTILVALYKARMSKRDENRGTDSTKKSAVAHNKQREALLKHAKVQKVNNDPIVPAWLAV